jgi:outer membrane biosynthesis protein TonB
MHSDDKDFRIALVISLIIHGGVIFFPGINFMHSPSPVTETEVTYLRLKAADAIKVQKQPLPKRYLSQKPALPQWQNPVYKSNSQKPLSPLFMKEKVFGRHDEFLTNRPQLSKPDIIAIKKRIALTPVEVNKISNTSYISYYQIVREKIKRCAYQNYTSQNIGEVYLSFAISSDGKLLKAKVSEEKTNCSSYLKEIALKSLNDASSFPAFPKDLDYPELTFNVIISFETE